MSACQSVYNIHACMYVHMYICMDVSILFVPAAAISLSPKPRPSHFTLPCPESHKSHLFANHSQEQCKHKDSSNENNVHQCCCDEGPLRCNVCACITLCVGGEGLGIKKCESQPFLGFSGLWGCKEWPVVSQTGKFIPPFPHTHYQSNSKSWEATKRWFSGI